MSIETLILAQNRPGWRRKGYIIYEKESPAVWGTQEKLPDFIVVQITGAVTVEEARIYREQWHCHYDWTVNNHNTTLDGYRVTIFGDKVNTSLEGSLTKTKADSLLLPMNWVYVSEGDNALTYDFGIYQTAISQWFWSRDVSSVGFTEIDYNEGTGVHTIEADYSIPAWPADKVAKIVEQRGGTVVSNAGNVITFSIDRATVNNELKDYFRQHVDNKVEERQFYVQASYVDSVVAGVTDPNVRPYDTKTKSEFLALINNRLDE